MSDKAHTHVAVPVENRAAFSSLDLFQGHWWKWRPLRLNIPVFECKSYEYQDCECQEYEYDPFQKHVTIMSSLYHPFFFFFPDFYLSYFHIWQCHVIQHQVDIHVVEAINIYFSWKFCFYILFSCESLHVCTTKSTSGNHHHNLRVAMAQRFVAMAAASCQCRFQHTNFSLSLHLLNLCSCKGADSRLKITWFEQYPLGHNNRLLFHLQRSIYIL